MRKLLFLLGAFLLCALPAGAQVPMTGAGLAKPASGGGALSCSYTPVTTGTQGVAYTGATPSASGGTPTYTFSETGSLPSGLTINTSTGVISGTPGANGSFPSIQVIVTDSLSATANCGTAFTLVIAAPGYVGPGDVISGAVAWWGMRAYNAAYATGSNPCLDLVDAGGLNPITINILSTGAVDVASINAWVIAHSVSTIFVNKWYDQTGNGHHMIGIGPAGSPKLTVAAVGSYAAHVTFASPNGQLKTSAGFAVAQPFTFVAVAKSTTNAVVGTLMSDSTGAQLLITTTPAIKVQANTALTGGTLTTGTWYALQGVANGASSVASINAADTSGNAGANGITASHVLEMGLDDFSEQLTGSIAEAGIWPSGFASTGMSANIRAYGSF